MSVTLPSHPVRSLSSSAWLVFVALGCKHDDAGSGSHAESAAPSGKTDFIDMPDAAPKASLWDDKRKLLYILGNAGNQIWTWNERAGLDKLAALPATADGGEPPPNVSLGQAALTADGTLVVMRFGQPGNGSFGGIGYVKPDKTAALVPNLDEKRRRLGLAVAPDGTLDGSYFSSGSSFVTTVDLSEGEKVVADGFGKIVGLAIADGRLYVSDQARGKVFDAPLAALPEHADRWHELATFPKPDQICPGPDHSLFSGSFRLRRVPTSRSPCARSEPMAA